MATSQLHEFLKFGPARKKPKPILRYELYNGGRVETGPLQFNDDWPGVFIRGDNAMHYAHQIDMVLRFGQGALYEGAMVCMYLEQLRNLLNSCAVGPAAAIDSSKR